METDALALSTFLGVARKSHEEAVLRLLVNLGLQVVGGDEGSLLVLDAADDALVFAMTVGDAESEKQLLGKRVPFGKGITGLAAMTQDVQIGAPTYRDVHQSERMSQAEGEPETVMAAPMLVGDDLVGVITAVSFQSGKKFSADDALLYARLASVAGLVVDQARRLRGVQALEDPNPGSADDEATAEMRIARSVSRIARTRPDKLEEVATLLAAIERLSAES